MRAPRPIPWRAAIVVAASLGLPIACSRTSGSTGAQTTSTATTASSNDAPLSTTCALPDASSFVPPAWIAPHPPQHVCSDDDLSQYVVDCIDPATAIPIHCEQFGADHAACAQCIFPDDATTGAGVFLPRAGLDALNVGGCIALLLDDASPAGCGAREQAARDCVASECESCDDPSCSTVAQQTACASFEMNTCRELAVAATCALDQGLMQDTVRIGRVMCGM